MRASWPYQADMQQRFAGRSNKGTLAPLASSSLKCPWRARPSSPRRILLDHVHELDKRRSCGRIRGSSYSPESVLPGDRHDQFVEHLVVNFLGTFIAKPRATITGVLAVPSTDKLRHVRAAPIALTWTHRPFPTRVTFNSHLNSHSITHSCPERQTLRANPPKPPHIERVNGSTRSGSRALRGRWRSLPGSLH
jgi:hypothetical protein